MFLDIYRMSLVDMIGICWLVQLLFIIVETYST